MEATHTIYRDGQRYPLFIDLASVTPDRQCLAYILPADEQPLATAHNSFGGDGQPFSCVTLTMRQAVYDLDKNSLLLTVAQLPTAGQQPAWHQVTLSPADLHGNALAWNSEAELYLPVV